MHLMRCLQRVPSEAMISLMSGILGTHGHARGPRATGHMAAPEPPPAPRGRSRAIGHMAIPKPYQAVVLVPRSCGDARAFLRSGRAWRHEARGDFRALSCWVAGLVPQGTWKHRSPFLAGGVLCAMGHVVTPEPSPGGWRALCLRACGGSRTL
jgi:hypothetical protein